MIVIEGRIYVGVLNVKRGSYREREQNQRLVLSGTNLYCVLLSADEHILCVVKCVCLYVCVCVCVCV